MKAEISEEIKTAKEEMKIYIDEQIQKCETDMRKNVEAIFKEAISEELQETIPPEDSEIMKDLEETNEHQDDYFHLERVEIPVTMEENIEEILEEVEVPSAMKKDLLKDEEVVGSIPITEDKNVEPEIPEEVVHEENIRNEERIEEIQPVVHNQEELQETDQENIQVIEAENNLQSSSVLIEGAGSSPIQEEYDSDDLDVILDFTHPFEANWDTEISSEEEDIRNKAFFTVVSDESDREDVEGSILLELDLILPNLRNLKIKDKVLPNSGESGKEIVPYNRKLRRIFLNLRWFFYIREHEDPALYHIPVVPHYQGKFSKKNKAVVPTSLQIIQIENPEDRFHHELPELEPQLNRRKRKRIIGQDDEDIDTAEELPDPMLYNSVEDLQAQRVAEWENKMEKSRKPISTARGLKESISAQKKVKQTKQTNQTKQTRTTRATAAKEEAERKKKAQAAALQQLRNKKKTTSSSAQSVAPQQLPQQKQHLQQLQQQQQNPSVSSAAPSAVPYWKKQKPEADGQSSSSQASKRRKFLEEQAAALRRFEKEKFERDQLKDFES